MTRSLAKFFHNLEINNYCRIFSQLFLPLTPSMPDFLIFHKLRFIIFFPISAVYSTTTLEPLILLFRHTLIIYSLHFVLVNLSSFPSKLRFIIDYYSFLYIIVGHVPPKLVEHLLFYTIFSNTFTNGESHILT